ncbi:MAG: CAP domain-containing protein [Desulfovibrio sp.]|jgi:uncharacterized protein YkwD|nr:CAP domain-containing protein [Desulfovibrio sp.]
MFRFGFTLVASVVCAALFRAPSASAAGLSDDHTVLYYLIEMQRRVTKTCAGRAVPEAPSLMPSEALRAEARKNAEGLTPPVRAQEAGVPAIYLTAEGGTPRQVFNSLAARRCPELMDAGYRYIGAAGKDGRWTVILSGAPALPEAAAPATRTSAPLPRAAPAPPGGTDRNAGENAYGPSHLRIRPEEREPAAPVPVGRVRTDAAGRPVGSVQFYAEDTAPPPDAPPLPPDARQTGRPAAMPDAVADDVPAGAGFVPPATPGPFGVRRPPQAEPAAGAARPGVTPLRDTRPQPAEDPLVYIAPGRTPTDTGGPAGATGQEDDIPLYGTGQETGDLPDRAGQGYAAPAGATDAAGRSGAEAGRPGAARLLSLVNSARAAGRRCGADPAPPAPPLAENPALSALAQRHAAAMTDGRFFSSTTPAGVTLGQRLTDAGYIWSFAAENIAHLDGTEEDVLHSWLAVENRCLNLMGAEYMEAGAGYDPAGRNWVLTLTAPMP